MTVPYDLAPAAVEIERLAAGVTERQFGDPTPCPGWPVAVVLDHLIGLADAFTDGARKTPRHDTPSRPLTCPPAGATCCEPGWRGWWRHGGTRPPGPARPRSAG